MLSDVPRRVQGTEHNAVPAQQAVNEVARLRAAEGARSPLARDAPVSRATPGTRPAPRSPDPA